MNIMLYANQETTHPRTEPCELMVNRKARPKLKHRNKDTKYKQKFQNYHDAKYSIAPNNTTTKSMMQYSLKERSGGTNPF